MGFECIDQPGQSSEVEHNPKKKHFIFFGGRGVVDGVWVYWQVWPTSEIKCNTKMSISRFWLKRGGRWGLSPLISLADHQKLNVIDNWAFHFFGRRGVLDGVQVHQSPKLIIRSERYLKTSISFFLAGEGWWMGFESIDQSGQHQKLNVIQKWAFHFLAGEGWWMGIESIDQLGQSSEVEHNQNMSISFFDWRGVVNGVQVHRQAWLIIRSWT